MGVTLIHVQTVKFNYSTCDEMSRNGVYVMQCFQSISWRFCGLQHVASCVEQLAKKLIMLSLTW